MTSELLKELMSKVSALQGDVSALQQQAPGKGSGKKRARDGDADGDEMPGSSRDGVDYQESEAGSDPEIMEDPDNEGDGLPLQISEEGQAFLEATFGSRLEFATRKAKLAKYGTPDSIWLKCPELCSVVAATLSKDAVKEDKVSFRAQQMWLDAAVPLTACLEKAHGGELTVADTIPMIQSALMLMGDASQHQSSLRRKLLMQHFNPQLKGLMGESDFSKAQPFLFGEDFGDKAKSKLEAAAALKKVAYRTDKGASKRGFRGGYPRRQNWGRGGGRQNSYGPGKSSKKSFPSGGNPSADRPAQ